MSGGSFEYLYLKDPYELLQNLEVLEDMVGFAADHPEIAAELNVLLRDLNAVNSQIAKIKSSLTRLRPIMKILEWVASGDMVRSDLKGVWEKSKPS